MPSKKFLCIGHPRCGTGYTSHLLKAFGWDVGHERMGRHGISSWMLAVDSPTYPWGSIGRDKGEPIKKFSFNMLIHVLRNPYDAIPSIILENKYSGGNKSFLFRQRFIQRELGIALPQSDDIETAIRTYLYWNKICENKNPDIVFRVEKDFYKLRRFNKSKFKIEDTKKLKRNHKKNRPKKPFRRLSPSHLESVDPVLKEEFYSFCSRYGYL